MHKTNQRRTRYSFALLFFGLVHFLQEPLECAPAFDAVARTVKWIASLGGTHRAMRSDSKLLRFATFPSDAALDRLVNGGVITHEQRGNAGAILQQRQQVAGALSLGSI